MKYRSIAALAATAVIVLGACGDDDDDTASSTPIAEVSTTTASGASTTAASGASTTTEAAGAPGTEAGGVSTEAGAVATEAVATSGGIAAGSGTEVMTTEAGAMSTEAMATSGGIAAGSGTAAMSTEGGAMSTEVMATSSGIAAGSGTEMTGTEMMSTDMAGTMVAGSEPMSTEMMGTDMAGTMAAGSEPMTTEMTGTMAAGSEPMTTEMTGTMAGGSDAVVPGSAGGGGSIIVGSADFPESALLAEIYGQALDAAGVDVSYELNIGSREAYITAIEDGEIDLVPEYTGNLLAHLIAPEQPSAVTVDEQVAALADALPDGLEVLTPSSAEDKDTIVCTQDVVDEYSLTDLSSLFAVADQITLGAPPEFETRTPFGLKGFADLYDANFKEFVPLASADIKDALSGGQIDCGNIFSTDPAITTTGFVALDDDQNIAAAQAIVPLIRSEVVTPEVTDALDAVDAALDTETLADLVSEVVVDQRGPDEVAAEFLATMSGGGESSAPSGSAPAGSASTDAASTETMSSEAMASMVPATTA